MGKVVSPAASISEISCQESLKLGGRVTEVPAFSISAVLEVTHLPFLFLSSTSLRFFSQPWPAST